MQSLQMELKPELFPSRRIAVTPEFELKLPKLDPRMGLLFRQG
jgi:hypothetical protein